jgi:hypothetical protein
MTTVSLPADLGIAHARELHAQLAAHLEAESVTLEGQEVGRMHAATFQVLAAFVRTRAAAGRATAWSVPSVTLSEGAARLGIQSLLALTPATS